MHIRVDPWLAGWRVSDRYASAAMERCPPSVLTLFLFFEELVQEIDGEGEYDGGVVLPGDLVKRLQVAELNRLLFTG